MDWTHPRYREHLLDFLLHGNPGADAGVKGAPNGSLVYRGEKAGIHDFLSWVQFGISQRDVFSEVWYATVNQ
jgi:hypothetical protein